MVRYDCSLFKKLPHGCQSGRMSQSSSPLTSYPQLQAWLSSPPEKPQQKTHPIKTKACSYDECKNLITQNCQMWCKENTPDSNAKNSSYHIITATHSFGLCRGLGRNTNCKNKTNNTSIQKGHNTIFIAKKTFTKMHFIINFVCTVFFMHIKFVLNLKHLLLLSFFHRIK